VMKSQKGKYYSICPFCFTKANQTIGSGNTPCFKCSNKTCDFNSFEAVNYFLD